MACEGESIPQSDATISLEDYHPASPIDSKELEHLSDSDQRCLEAENTIITEEETTVLHNSQDDLNPDHSNVDEAVIDSQSISTALDTHIHDSHPVSTALDTQVHDSHPVSTALDTQVHDSHPETTALDTQVHDSHPETTAIETQVHDSHPVSTALDTQVHDSHPVSTALDTQVHDSHPVSTALDTQVHDSHPETTALDTLVHDSQPVTTLVHDSQPVTTALDTQVHDSQPVTTALDTLVQTACQNLPTTNQSIATIPSPLPADHAGTDSLHELHESYSVGDDAEDHEDDTSTPVLLETAIAAATSSSVVSHSALSEFNGTIGAIFETNGNHEADVHVVASGSGINGIDLPTMAFKQSPLHVEASDNMETEHNDIEEIQEMDTNEEETDSLRKSDRKRKPARPKSPENMQKFKKKKKRTRHQSSSVNQLPEQPFKCDLCESPYVTNPSRRGNRMKTSSHQPSPRHKLDPQTGKRLTLCNACGLSFDRPKKAQREKSQPDATEKNKYLEEAHAFALSLVDGLGDPDAERLSCPHFKTRACGCLQAYIIGDGNDMVDSRNRASELLQLLKQAKELSKMKCYDVSSLKTKTNLGKVKRVRHIGLGNGQRKAKDFEDFVLEKRSYLRETLKLCERATQRVLLYSNNFLHKKLKTDPAKSIRIKRQKGKAALGKLKPLDDLPKERCCVDNCVMIAVSHMKLIQNWRDRATSGQIEARRVLAEMLTPSGGARSNCYKFISWVTGCSHSTIGRVNEQMKDTGGDREPPTHGLIKWWREHPKPKKPKPVKQVPQQVSQVDAVQQLALQQIQQAVPQMANFLQSTNGSMGITAVIIPPSVANAVPLATTLPLSTTLPLATVNTAAIAQSQIPTVTVTNGGLQLQQVHQQQQIQVHLQQQQSQYQQQIQQLQLQQLQLQQQQQQLQQQLQQTTQQLQQTTQQQQLTQSIQHCLASQIQVQTAQATAQQVVQHQQQELHVVQQQPTQATQQQATQIHQESAQTETPQDTQHSVSIPPMTNVLTVTIPANLSVSQATPLTTETFLTTDAFQLLNSVPGVQHQVITIPVTSASGLTQGIPVSLIQTSNVQNTIQ